MSDFGKLADPFCDVFYRMGVLLAAVLPAGLVGLEVAAPTDPRWQTPTYITSTDPLVMGTGIFLFTHFNHGLARNIRRSPARHVCHQGLGLGRRLSGKSKHGSRGLALISSVGIAAIWTSETDFIRAYAFYMAWICALFSAASFFEYLWVNRSTLQLPVAARKTDEVVANSEGDKIL